MVRDNLAHELREALRANGIDVRDKALTQEMARNLIHNRNEEERLAKMQEERVDMFAKDQVLKERYYREVRQRISDIEPESY